MSDEPTSEQLSAACAALVRLWHTRGEINPDRHVDRYHDTQLHTVSGLAAHAYRTGETAARLIRDGHWLEASPLVRTSFECAVTAHWVAQVRDGVQALLNEDYRSRRNMADSLRKSEAWVASGLQVPTPDDQDHESFSNAQARNFKQLCDDLAPGGVQAYAYYKSLCWFSHPTNYVIDHYTDIRVRDGSYRLTLRRDPRVNDDNAYIVAYFNAAALVWAAAALNFLDADKAHEGQIAELAKKVHIDPILMLSDKARARVQNDRSSEL